MSSLAEESAKPPLAVVCVLLEDRGLVLLARRSSGALAGFWEFPGGKIQAGESPEQALQRECREELGCGLEIHEALAVIRHEYPWGSIELAGYVASLKGSDPPLALEHSELRWVNAAELSELQLAPADVPLAQLWLQRQSAQGLAPQG